MRVRCKLDGQIMGIDRKGFTAFTSSFFDKLDFKHLL